MKPLRICAFFQHMPPYAGAAALRGASVMGALAQRCQGQPVDIEVLTTTPSPSPLPGATVRALPVGEVENDQKLLTRGLGEVRVGFVAARHMFRRDDQGRRCDLAVVSTPAYVAALVLTAHARWYRVPYVLELRDVYPQVYAEAGLVKRESLGYRFFAWCSARMYATARQVITATRGLQREVQQQAPKARVSCVYNGFPAPLALRRANKHERFTVCFHGVLGYFQDVETLVKVAQRLQPDDVDVLTIGYGRKEAALKEAALPNLRHLGRLNFEATMAEIERCHLGLCLRLDDGISKDAFPVKVWEYLGLGIPAIVTPPCEAGEFLQAHRCGLQLGAGDVEAIVAAVLQLKAEPERLQALTDNCRRAGWDYTREQTGMAAAALIQDALARAAAQALREQGR